MSVGQRDDRSGLAAAAARGHPQPHAPAVAARSSRASRAANVQSYLEGSGELPSGSRPAMLKEPPCAARLGSRSAPDTTPAPAPPQPPVVALESRRRRAAGPHASARHHGRWLRRGPFELMISLRPAAAAAFAAAPPQPPQSAPLQPSPQAAHSRPQAAPLAAPSRRGRLATAAAASRSRWCASSAPNSLASPPPRPAASAPRRPPFEPGNPPLRRAPVAIVGV